LSRHIHPPALPKDASQLKAVVLGSYITYSPDSLLFAPAPIKAFKFFHGQDQYRTLKKIQNKNRVEGGGAFISIGIELNDRFYF